MLGTQCWFYPSEPFAEMNDIVTSDGLCFGFICLAEERCVDTDEGTFDRHVANVLVIDANGEMHSVRDVPVLDVVDTPRWDTACFASTTQRPCPTWPDEPETSDEPAESESGSDGEGDGPSTDATANPFGG